MKGCAVDREHIEQIALGLFLERGYDSVTVQDICDACNISKPTFYARVRSKDDLIVSYYDGVTRSLTERLGELVDARSHWEQLMVCFGTLVDETEHVGPELMARMLQINLREDQHSFDERAYLTDVMVAIIRRGQEAGELTTALPAEKLYDAAAYLFQGYMTMWCVRKGQMDWRSEFEESLRALLRCG